MTPMELANQAIPTPGDRLLAVSRRQCLYALGLMPCLISGRSAHAQAQPTMAQVSLDRLFAKLKKARSETEGRRIERQIWRHWTRHPDPNLHKLMQQIMADRKTSTFDRALAFADEIIAADPGYAEAYNQRASIAFAQGKYLESLQDIALTLEREPRHFGALTGRAVIRLRQGKPALAIQNLLVAVEIHPFLPERHLLTKLGFSPSEKKTRP